MRRHVKSIVKALRLSQMQNGNKGLYIASRVVVEIVSNLIDTNADTFARIMRMQWTTNT